MHLSQQDIFTGLITMGIIAMVLICIQLCTKNKWLNKLTGRKLLHIAAICTCAWAIHRFENRILLAGIFLLFFVILLGVIQKGWMQVNETKTYGIAFFPLAFAALLFIPAFGIPLIVYAVLILGISDAAAGLTGEYLGKKKIVFLSENKSWAGFAAFYISAIMVSLFYFQQFSLHGLLFCAAVSVLPALTELFSYRGSDNFTVPLFSATWALLLTDLSTIQLLVLLLLAIVFAGLARFAVYRKWLTISGAAAACWMAVLLCTTGGYKAFLAPGIFLITGSLLSKLNKPAIEKDGRNARQVFANGITGLLFLIVFAITRKDVYLLSALVSFCISMADTCSSELGFYFKGPTYDMLSFKKLPPGVSGGVSAAGTLGGLTGALLLSFITGQVYHFPFEIFTFIAAAGFTGMLMDSLLGSWLQVKYCNINGVITDEPLPGAKKLKGFYWCSNDVVNITSNVIITLLFFYTFSK